MLIDFINQLQAIGLSPVVPATGKVYFEWTVPVGPNYGRLVLVGTTVTDAYPGTCPSAPHFKPLDENWKEHASNVSDSSFGQGWETYLDDHPASFYQTGWRYWSRRFDEWPASEKNAKIYLAHLKKIMMSL